MKQHLLAGLAFASLSAHAQIAGFAPQPGDPILVTASRGMTATETLRDAVVITRDEIEAAGPITLGELLQRKAGIELRATGGPGQPESIFIRGAGSAQTLVLVDGLRVGSATVGTTPIEHIPLEMIERIEVVKGPLSSLYGSDAIGGVIQVFTRGKNVPHLFTSVGYGTDNDRRISAGLAASDGDTHFSLAGGYRAVNAPSATNPRAGPFVFNPDRDPFDDSFFTFHAGQKMWNGEDLEVDAFSSYSHTHFDSGPTTDDRTRETVSGARLSSSTLLGDSWSSRLTLGVGDDKLDVTGAFPDRFETRQVQAAWLNELPLRDGKFTLGAETLRQKIYFDPLATPFTNDHRDTNGIFAGARETYGGQTIEGSARYDNDSQFGGRTTGSLSYGFEWTPGVLVAGTYARGFRAPTFFDLYGPPSSFFQPNPNLQPERSRSYELSIAWGDASTSRWRFAAFDNHFDDLIAFDSTLLTQVNVARARAQGIEGNVQAQWMQVNWKGSVTVQRPRDEDTGFRLQGRAEKYGTIDASRTFGDWTVGATVLASGERFDSANEDPASRLGGYTVVDARVRYVIAPKWTAEVVATNLFDKHYETVVGYDAPRRGVMLNVRFESF